MSRHANEIKSKEKKKKKKQDGRDDNKQCSLLCVVVVERAVVGGLVVFDGRRNRNGPARFSAFHSEYARWGCLPGRGCVYRALEACLIAQQEQKSVRMGSACGLLAGCHQS